MDALLSSSLTEEALCVQVPYDDDLPFLFFGEEAGMLVRMWTRGFDPWIPPQAVAFHLWSRAYRRTLQKDIPTVSCTPTLMLPKSSLTCLSSLSIRKLQHRAAGLSAVSCCVDGIVLLQGRLKKLVVEFISKGRRRLLQNIEAKKSSQQKVRSLFDVQPHLEATEQRGEASWQPATPESSPALWGSCRGSHQIEKPRSRSAAQEPSAFGLGRERSLAAFFDFCGVDFSNRCISSAAKSGGLDPSCFA